MIPFGCDAPTPLSRDLEPRSVLLLFNLKSNYLQSSHPRFFMIRNRVYVRTATKMVISDAPMIAKQMIRVVSFSGSIRFGFTPGGGFRAGVVSGLDDMLNGMLSSDVVLGVDLAGCWGIRFE